MVVPGKAIGLLVASTFWLAALATQAQAGPPQTYSLPITLPAGTVTKTVTFAIPTCPAGTGFQEFHLTNLLVMPTNGTALPTLSSKWGAYAQLWQSWSSGSTNPWIGGMATGTDAVNVTLPGGRNFNSSATVRVSLVTSQATPTTFTVTVTGVCDANIYLTAPPS